MAESIRKILLLGFSSDSPVGAYLPEIEKHAKGYDIVTTNDEAEVEHILDRIEIAAGHFPRELISGATALRWLQLWGAGADWLLEHPEVRNRDIVVTNASGVHAVPISEHIFAMILAMGRGIPRAARSQSAAEWRRSSHKDVFELERKTMLLAGLGAIGSRTARLAKAFGMRVIGIKRTPSKSVPEVDEVHGPEETGALLPKADFVVLTIPLTRETVGFIGERELRSMKSSAVLVNIGRGKTVNERMLIQALKEGWIAGACLDVFEEEPLPAASPLWKMENVIITSHYAGITPLYWERAMTIFLGNLRLYVQGEPMHNVVDLRLGY